MQQMYSITLNIHAKSNLPLYFLIVSDRLYSLELCARFYLKLRLDSFPILQQFRHKQHFIHFEFDASFRSEHLISTG